MRFLCHVTANADGFALSGIFGELGGHDFCHAWLRVCTGLGKSRSRRLHVLTSGLLVVSGSCAFGLLQVFDRADFRLKILRSSHVVTCVKVCLLS